MINGIEQNTTATTYDLDLLTIVDNEEVAGNVLSSVIGGSSSRPLYPNVIDLHPTDPQDFPSGTSLDRSPTTIQHWADWDHFWQWIYWHDYLLSLDGLEPAPAEDM